MDVFYKKLGAKVRKIRESLDLSQERIAKSLEINRVAVSQIENGERKISAEEIVKLSRIFNMPSDVLLDLEKDIKVILENKKPSKKGIIQEIWINVPLSQTSDRQQRKYSNLRLRYNTSQNIQSEKICLQILKRRSC